MEIVREKYGENHIEYAKSLKNLCFMLFKLGRYKISFLGYLKAF
jgi:hypothetical protein